ncbi:NHLP leader peptide family natural product precursor [Scytonema hofmannii PCC 7110]|uniref:NHLP leader peptide family natural product n=1 Tax=Scytonema hofmannii PCC 7110 TaxID=128403 RepID=A0A139WYU2_9CYAN|nr:NHLP leader peptide family RiPP precursor [Scytonema hofmannii]KYC37615.1 NHLP leader peptide family natural product precursor [Scytonema hofmannii PCC 7110]
MTQAGANPSNSERDFLDEQLKARLGIESALIAKAWVDENFKQELISDPKGMIARELNTQIPDGVEVQILEETPTTYYLSIPMKPSVDTEEELSDEELEAVAGGGVKKSIFNTVMEGVKGCSC